MLLSTADGNPMATHPTQPTDHLPGELADAFGRAGKSVVRAFDERLGEHGVSTPRSKLLAEIQRTLLAASDPSTADAMSTVQ